MGLLSEEKSRSTAPIYMLLPISADLPSLLLQDQHRSEKSILTHPYPPLRHYSSHTLTFVNIIWLRHDVTKTQLSNPPIGIQLL